MTIAILDVIQNNREYDKYIKEYIKKYSRYIPNFSSSFSPELLKWAENEKEGKSCGNGAMMRISPVGYLLNIEKEIIKNAREATIPSHDCEEAIDGATIALMIYYFRNGLTKEEIYKKLNLEVKYEPFKKFDTTCHETLKNCLYVIYNSKSFEDAMRLTLMMGWDTDTNCAIVGSVAEAMYGINQILKSKAEKSYPKNLLKY